MDVGRNADGLDVDSRSRIRTLWSTSDHEKTKSNQKGIRTTVSPEWTVRGLRAPRGGPWQWAAGGLRPLNNAGASAGKAAAGRRRGPGKTRRHGRQGVQLQWKVSGVHDQHQAQPPQLQMPHCLRHLAAGTRYRQRAAAKVLQLIFRACVCRLPPPPAPLRPTP